jgi:hypothetical protein
MLTCTICHFDTELDDIVVTTGAGRCVCLRCYGRETESDRPMPKALRREVVAALETMDVA